MSFGKPKDDPKELEKIAALQPNPTAPKVEAFLGRGSKVVGTLNFSGPVELDGTVEGEIIAQDRLTVGEAAIINAKISGSEIVVKGTVNGDIIASKKLSLKKPAKVIGNISASNLSIEEGVIFEGSSSMNVGKSTEASPFSKTISFKSPNQEKLGAA